MKNREHLIYYDVIMIRLVGKLYLSFSRIENLIRSFYFQEVKAKEERKGADSFRRCCRLWLYLS